VGIRYACEKDLESLYKFNSAIPISKLRKKIISNEVMIFENCDEKIGVLRFCYLWGYIPFVELLYIKKSFRKSGVGTKLTLFFEKEMSNKGYEFVFTSTQVDEQAQHFYRKLGYIDSGTILIPNQAAELFLIKHL